MSKFIEIKSKDGKKTYFINVAQIVKVELYEGKTFICFSSSRIDCNLDFEQVKKLITD